MSDRKPLFEPTPFGNLSYFALGPSSLTSGSFTGTSWKFKFGSSPGLETELFGFRSFSSTSSVRFFKRRHPNCKKWETSIVIFTWLISLPFPYPFVDVSNRGLVTSDHWQDYDEQNLEEQNHIRIHILEYNGLGIISITQSLDDNLGSNWWLNSTVPRITKLLLLELHGIMASKATSRIWRCSCLLFQAALREGRVLWCRRTTLDHHLKPTDYRTHGLKAAQNMKSN
ncbi:hypothetical protein PVL29_026204 [Vitis rotundifolia]|uniref:Uncharacterized protein n=1 Tax=Vitis rotundifolia TaxID=103349 RepID=A0AA38YLW4_VITRO|nr:hypothetical protein PVL29_026204 [Vitis rotundifolia]